MGSQAIPPLPPGYTLTSDIPPLPAGYKLEQPNLADTLAKARVENAKPLPSQYQPEDTSYSGQVKKNVQSGADFYKAIGSDVKNAATSPSTYLGPAVGGGIDAIKQLYQAAKDGHFQAEPAFLDRIGGALGINTQDADKQSFGTTIGHAALPLAVVAGARASGATDAMVNPAKEAFNRAKAGPTANVLPQSGKLPMLAQSGVEDVFRAAAPTGTNVGFRDNVIAAAGDLAEIGQKAKLTEAKGGIINPDMRVRATVKAIDEHLGEMYQQERAPQIAAHADAPVDIPLGDATRGLEFIKRSGGTLADQALADKAIKTGTLTLAEADKLAQTANQYLKSFESMTASEKLEAISKTPKIGGLKALDVALGKNMNEVLTQSGEVGLRSYERRYAALSEVRDQLGSRINATELKQEGLIGAAGRVTRPLAKLVSSGPTSALASASQSATADVNVGKRLQFGLQKLASSGITPER